MCGVKVRIYAEYHRSMLKALCCCPFSGLNIPERTPSLLSSPAPALQPRTCASSQAPSSASIRSSSSISDLLRSRRMVESSSISSTRLTTSALEDILGHHLLRSFDLFDWEECRYMPARLRRIETPRRAGAVDGRGHVVHVPLLAVPHQA